MWIIDRFEENFAVCETEAGERVELLRADLPADACEGDVLRMTPKGYVRDEAETKIRREENEALLASLLEK